MTKASDLDGALKAAGDGTGMTNVEVPTELAFIITDVLAEVERQVSLWGVQVHPDGTGPYYKSNADKAKVRCAVAVGRDTLTWLNIAEEEFWEAMAEDDPAKLREESIQVIAVFMSWLRDQATRTETKED